MFSRQEKKKAGLFEEGNKASGFYVPASYDERTAIRTRFIASFSPRPNSVSRSLSVFANTFFSPVPFFDVFVEYKEKRTEEKDRWTEKETRFPSYESRRDNSQGTVDFTSDSAKKKRSSVWQFQNALALPVGNTL